MFKSLRSISDLASNDPAGKQNLDERNLMGDEDSMHRWKKKKIKMSFCSRFINIFGWKQNWPKVRMRLVRLMVAHFRHTLNLFDMLVRYLHHN